MYLARFEIASSSFDLFVAKSFWLAWIVCKHVTLVYNLFLLSSNNFTV